MLGTGTPPGRLPLLPPARLPGSSGPGQGGNIGGLLPVIKPSPTPSSPGEVRHAAYGRDDSVTMGLEPASSSPDMPVLLAAAAAIVIAAAGGWLAITRRGRKRHAPSVAPVLPGQIPHVAYGMDDSVTMGPGSMASRLGAPELVAFAAAVVIIAAIGGRLAVTRRGRKRRAP